jgi:hypothetical protein
LDILPIEEFLDMIKTGAGDLYAMYGGDVTQIIFI